MGRPTRSGSTTVVLLTFPLLLACTLGACSSSPTPQTDPSESNSQVRPLRGVTTPYSMKLSDLGDTDLLGDDSTMRGALVGGDRDVVVAASMLQGGDTFALDLIVLNRLGEPIQLTRSDLQVVDADGRWLSSVEEWDEGAKVGLRGRRVERTQSNVVVDFDSERSFDHSRLMQNLNARWGAGPTQTKQNVQPRPNRRRGDDEDPSLGAQPEIVAPNGSPARVVVPPADGRAFWAYFGSADQPVAFPLTAVVVVDGEQLLFRFDR